MKFHQKFGLPFLPLLTCYVEVTDERVRRRRFLRTLFDYDLAKTTATYQPQGLSGFIHGYGDVTLKEESKSESAVSQVIRGAALRQYIDSQRKRLERQSDDPIERDSRETQKVEGGARDKLTAETIPENVALADQVLCFPPLPAMFEKQLWYLHLKIRGNVGACPKFHVGYGDWINRGEPICSYQMRGSMFDKVVEIPILSPVSGILIGMPEANSMRHWGAILVKEDGRGPDTVRQSFGAFTDYCFQHRRYIFRAQNGWYRSDSEIRQSLERSINNLHQSPWAIASLVEWLATETIRPASEALAELMEYRPHLREPLRQLIGKIEENSKDVASPPVSESIALIANEKPTVEDRNEGKSESEEEFRRQAELGAAREWFGLGEKFSAVDVREAYLRLKPIIGPSLRDNFETDYRLLMKHARQA